MKEDSTLPTGTGTAAAPAIDHMAHAQASPYLAFAEAAARYPDHAFLHVPASAWRRYSSSAADRAATAADGSLTVSYRTMLARIEAQRARYAQAGYGVGHRVALSLENRPDFFVHFFALNSLGASIVPLNGDYRPPETAYVIEHSGADLAVGVDATLPALREALGAAFPIVDAALAALGDLPHPTRPPASGNRTHTASLDDECAILYTSGTTGKPKGCVLDNRYFLSIAYLYVTEGGLCTVRPGVERLITPLPLFHMNALACSTMAMVVSGGCVVQMDRFHPRSWWQEVIASQATIIHYLGVMPAILLSLAPDAEGGNAAGHQVRFGYGANVDPRHQTSFETRFGFPLIEGWAMTETGGAVVIASSAEPRHPGSRCFGKPRAGMQIRLVDADGREVADGMPGQLLVRRAGANPREGFFRGYLKDPATTEAAWAGGWFHTGDVVRRGPDGSLHFVDRQKNIIRRAGENIAALEVEACLLEHDAVKQTAVIAAPDALRDEEVMACVILRDGYSADAETAQALQRWCLERMTYFKAPGYVAFVDALPTTATNKVQKTQLAAFGADPLNAPLCFDLRALKKR